MKDEGKGDETRKVPLRGEQNGAVLQRDKEFYTGEYSTRITLSGSIELAPGPVFCRNAAVSKLSLPLSLSLLLYTPLLSSATLFPPYFPASLALTFSLSLSLSLSLFHFLCLSPYAFAFFSSKRFGRRTSIVPPVKRMHFKSCRTMKIQRRQWYKQFLSSKLREANLSFVRR